MAATLDRYGCATSRVRTSGLTICPDASVIVSMGAGTGRHCAISTER